MTRGSARGMTSRAVGSGALFGMMKPPNEVKAFRVRFIRTPRGSEKFAAAALEAINSSQALPTQERSIGRDSRSGQIIELPTPANTPPSRLTMKRGPRSRHPFFERSTKPRLPLTLERSFNLSPTSSEFSSQRSFALPLLPNVKDEPRHELARFVALHES